MATVLHGHAIVQNLIGVWCNQPWSRKI